MWKTNNSREYIPYFLKPCRQFKSNISWKPSHYCSSSVTSWDARSVWKDNMAPCSFLSLAKTPRLPGKEITMSDHVGHQAASRRHQSITNPSPVACAGPQSVTSHTLSSGKVAFPRACLHLQSLSPQKCLVPHSHLIPKRRNAKFWFLHAQQCSCRVYFKWQCSVMPPHNSRHRNPREGIFLSKVRRKGRNRSNQFFYIQTTPL